MIWTIPDKNKVVLYVAALCEFYDLQRVFGFVREVRNLSPVPVFRQDWKLGEQAEEAAAFKRPGPSYIAHVCSCAGTTSSEFLYIAHVPGQQAQSSYQITVFFYLSKKTAI